MKFFVDLLRRFTDPSVSTTQALVIYDKGEGDWIALKEDKKETETKSDLLKIYSKGFWNLWNNGYRT